MKNFIARHSLKIAGLFVLGCVVLIFIVGCANCNTFIPKEELNHYYLGGALRGADCLKKSKPTDKAGTWLNCVQDKFEDNFPYYVEFHEITCKYKMFAQ